MQLGVAPPHQEATRRGSARPPAKPCRPRRKPTSHSLHLRQARATSGGGGTSAPSRAESKKQAFLRCSPMRKSSACTGLGWAGLGPLKASAFPSVKGRKTLAASQCISESESVLEAICSCTVHTHTRCCYASFQSQSQSVEQPGPTSYGGKVRHSNCWSRPASRFLLICG